MGETRHLFSIFPGIDRTAKVPVSVVAPKPRWRYRLAKFINLNSKPVGSGVDHHAMIGPKCPKEVVATGLTPNPEANHYDADGRAQQC
jgi:hypothetical protein